MRLRFFLLFALCCLMQAAGAHDLRFVKATMNLDLEARSYQLAVQYDVDSFLAGVDPYHMTDAEFRQIEKLPRDKMEEGLEKARATLEKSVSIEFDGKPEFPDISFPEYIDGMPTSPMGAAGYYLEHTRRVLFTGEIPEGAQDFTLTTKNLGNCSLVIRQEGSDVEVQYATAANETTPPYSLKEPPKPLSGPEVVAQFGTLGFEHIIPEGIDHILFVLGLFLLAAQFRPLFWQITAFTIAHSVTLLLSVYDVVSVQGPIVEAIVALSIAYVAVENLVTQKLHWWRPLVVFCFGLLHGLGFAGGLKEIGIPDNHFLLALFSFNIGVEVGHLSVVGVAFLCIGWFREKPWYRVRVVYPISSIIALIAITWSIQRFWGLYMGAE
ncbi:hypothetical protein GC173_17320 [bacterium]|nr:hypothetical protein [bacterium]